MYLFLRYIIYIYISDLCITFFFQHTFKEPEPRPPHVVSLLFTVLSLTPLLVLFVLVSINHNHIIYFI